MIQSRPLKLFIHCSIVEPVLFVSFFQLSMRKGGGVKYLGKFEARKTILTS